jgi:DNA-directed RNA polymerase specialized sigma24 family protein
VYLLARDGGLSHVEISEVMGISPQTVANQMSSAISDLRRYLACVLEER